MKEIYRLHDVKQSTTTPYHPMGNGVVKNFNKTIKKLLKKVAAEKPANWHRYLGSLMFAVRDTPQDSTGFTPFELIYGHKVRTPMTLLKRIWTSEGEDPDMKTAYQYVIDLRERVEQTCDLARKELAKVQTRNQNYYNRRTRERKLRVGNSVLLLLPTENNKLSLAWRGPYKVVEVVGEADYRIEMDSGKVKTNHINMLKRYFHRDEIKPDKVSNERDVDKPDQVHQAASVACVLEDEEVVEDLAVNDLAMLLLYNLMRQWPM